jgi:hypothetical protein
LSQLRARRQLLSANAGHSCTAAMSWVVVAFRRRLVVVIGTIDSASTAVLFGAASSLGKVNCASTTEFLGRSCFVLAHGLVAGKVNGGIDDAVSWLARFVARLRSRR